jgi:hypothetical protein
MMKKYNQLLPVLLAFTIFLVVSVVYFVVINLLNLFPGEKLYTGIFLADVLVGLTIYLKTSVDFALLMGLLMRQFPGIKNRIAIESGTAFGNATGTIAVLVVWYFFKEVTWLLAIMVFTASLVLFKLSQTSLEHIEEDKSADHTSKYNQFLSKTTNLIEQIVSPINNFTAPLLNKIIPDLSFKTNNISSTWVLFLASFTIPFILGLDDFAGYVPLFNIVNVFGFGVGVFLGHTILNTLLFINPDVTIKVVKNPVISIIGSIVFVGLGLWGLYEVYNIINAGYLHFGGILP